MVPHIQTKRGKSTTVQITKENVNMPKDMYEELVIDLVSNCKMNMFDARRIVNYLRSESIVSNDTLREHYMDDEE